MKIYVIRHATLNDMDVIMDMIDKGFHNRVGIADNLQTKNLIAKVLFLL